MADTVTTIRQNGILHLTNLCDGTGESAVVKIDRSGVMDEEGNTPTKFAITKIQANIYGFTYVDLLFDHTSDQVVARLSPGQYLLDYSEMPLVDLLGAGGTGDLLLTTAGNTAGDFYDIMLWVKYL